MHTLLSFLSNTLAIPLLKPRSPGPSGHSLLWSAHVVCRLGGPRSPDLVPRAYTYLRAGSLRRTSTRTHTHTHIYMSWQTICALKHSNAHMHLPTCLPTYLPYLPTDLPTSPMVWVSNYKGVDHRGQGRRGVSFLTCSTRMQNHRTAEAGCPVRGTNQGRWAGETK